MLDVVVRDRSGRPVRDLRADEVTVVEDGVRREVQLFRLVDRTGAPATAPEASAGELPEPLRYPTLVTLAFDHLTQNGRALARQAALRFVAGELPPNRWVAVVALDQRLHLAQAFTRDVAALRQAIDRATATVGESRDRIAAAQDDADRAARAAEAAVGAIAGDRPSADTAAIGAAVTNARVTEVISRMARMAEMAEIQHRGQSTLFPLMALMKAQGGLSGRKALVFFSEGFQIPPNLEEAYRSAISEANRANVSIYAVDARGLDTGRALEQSRQMLERSARNSQSQLVAGSSQRPVTLEDVMNSENAEGALRADTQSALRALAEETSGGLIANTNDLGPGLVDRVHADLDSYYEIGYTPAQTTADGRFRSVQVKVARRGVAVHSRSGYFALPDTDATPLLPFELPMLAAAAAVPPPNAFDFTSAAFRFDRTAQRAQYTLVMEVPLERLTFNEDRRTRRYSLKFTALALLKNQAGEVVQRLSETYPLEGPLDRLAALKRGRLRFKRQVWIAPGRYTLATVARDQATERSSVRVLNLDVPHASGGIRISDPCVIRTVEQAGETADPVEDPFRTGAIRVVPNLDLPISKAANTDISLYVTVYPDGASPPPSLVFEFSRDRELMGRAAAELPNPDEAGRIKYVASFPTTSFAPGTYEVRAIASQGAQSAEATTRFTVVP